MEGKVMTHEELRKIDWSKHSLELGVALTEGDPPWLELDRVELLVLRKALKGTPHEGLKELLAWVDAALAWTDKNVADPEVRA